MSSRYNLKKRPKLFLPGCKVKVSAAGLKRIGIVSKINGGWKPKWYKGRIGTILYIDKGIYYLNWGSESDPDFQYQERWDTAEFFLHYKPRKKK